VSEWRKRLIRLLGGEVPKPKLKPVCLRKMYATTYATSRGAAFNQGPPISTITAAYCICPDCKPKEKP
jgi:hypothetical protein